GLPGFDIVCLTERAEGVWRMLVAAGAAPAGPDTYETLRIETGTPLFGPDIDTTRFVMEVGNAARAVSYTKGCFLGQEPIAMARDRAGHVNRAFLGLKVLGGGPLPAGSKVFHDGQEVGLVTSSCHSPRLGAPVARRADPSMYHRERFQPASTSANHAPTARCWSRNFSESFGTSPCRKNRTTATATKNTPSASRRCRTAISGFLRTDLSPMI